MPLSRAAQPATARRVLSAVFFLHGLIFASWYARIPEIKQRLAMSDGVLGVVLFVAAGATVIGLVWVGRLVDTFGSHRVTAPGAVVVPLALLGPGFAPSVAALAGSLFVLGLAAGVLNVAMNAHAIQVEREYGHSIMTSFHAAYSLGGLTGAALGALCVYVGISPAVAFCVLGLVLAATALGLGPGLLPDRPESASGPKQPAGSWRAGVDLRILLLGACAFAALLAEGVTADWSAVYLRDSLHASAAVAAGGFLVFSISMTAGRLWGDALARRVDTALLVRTCALIAVAGQCLALATGSLTLALIGIAVFGIGLSCVLPQLFRAVGKDAARVGRAVGTVATMGYLGLLCGPALIGTVAQLVGLRASLVIVAVLMAAVVGLYPSARATRTTLSE